MSEIIRNRTIRPSSRGEQSKGYKINTSNVTSKDTLIVNIDHENKSFKKSFTFSGNQIGGKKSISFHVKESKKKILISWIGILPKNAMDTNSYFKFIAEQLFSQFNSIIEIKKITNNPVIIGAYSEAIIRNWLRENIFKESILTGSIISPELANRGNQLQQMDTIIYCASPLPPIFKVDDFGLVPANSAYAIIEIKRTNYTKAVVEIERVLTYTEKFKKRKKHFTITEGDNIGSEEVLMLPDSFGIVCLKTSNEKKLMNLNSKEKIYYFLEKDPNGAIKINAKDVFRFVNRILLIKEAIHNSFGLISKNIISQI